MHITVAICTWNRAKLLDQTLAEMHKLHIPARVTWELLVVNNNCTDATDEVIARHAASLPIRRLFEPKQGLSNARNCAVAAASGDLMIWTDDDVLVDPNWLAAYVDAANSWPDAAFFGGRITPWYEITPPKWVKANEKRLEGLLVCFDLGLGERLFKPSETPWGANMAMRACTLRKHAFNHDLGVTGDVRVGGEETELFQRLCASGFHGVWVPAAEVRHFIPIWRLSRQFLWRYFHGFGRTTTRREGVEEDARLWWGAPRWLYRRMATSWTRYFAVQLLGRNSWVRHYVDAAMASGMICECRWQTREMRRRGR